MSSSEIQLNSNIIERAKAYKLTIDSVYEGTNPNIIESQLLGELLKLLSEIPQGFHLFCDPVLNPISIFCLTIFSFNEQETVNWLKNKYNPILSQCKKCILNFTRGKCNMLQHFAIQRHVPHEHVSKFNDIVCLWRIESLLPTLRNIRIIDNKEVDITKEIEFAMFESVCNPHSLRLNKELKNYFNVIFKYLYNSKHHLLSYTHPDGIDIFLPGIIYCWCEGSQEEINWSKNFLNHLHEQKFTINSKGLTSDILQEIYFHFLFLQNPSNWNDVIISQFWIRFYPIFRLFDSDVFIEYFIVPKNIESLKQNIRYPIESIFKLWYNHLIKHYNDKPLDILLRVLNMFLEKLNGDFWLKLEPYSFHSILDNIFEGDTFATKLIRIQNVPLPNNEIELIFAPGSVSDLLSWTLPFYQSLSSSKRIQMVKKVSMTFLRIIANYPVLKSIPKACLMNSSTALLSAVLTIKEEERAQLYHDEDFQTLLFTKIDSRTLLNNPLVQDVVIKSSTNPSGFYPGLGDSASSVAKSSMIVLTKCIDFDILLLCQRTFKLYNGKQISDLPLPLTLLENITKNIDLRSFHDGPLLAKELMISLKNINGLLPILSKLPIVEKHNQMVNNYLTLSTKIVEKFTDILPSQLSQILSDRDATQGFWSCVFSSNTHLYQAATNILYDTFDVQGRLEGIQSIMNNSMANQLNAINIVLGQLIKCEFYEPCPRAIRVLMDIVKAFSDPVSGIISNYASLKSVKSDEAIVKFWQLAWLFLDTIYRCTLKWAAKYEYSELENFTKDTLELSRSLVASYREFSDILDSPKIDLFECILNTLKNMLYWLRLSDEELLDSCVKLIIATADLAQEKNIKFNDILVEQMAKYGSKARKFSNKLTETQTSDILSKAKLFNVEIANRVIKETEDYRKEKESARIKNQGTSITAQLKTASAAETKAAFLERKATSSSITGRPKVSQPKITAFGKYQPNESTKLHSRTAAKPMSRMEQARRQLLNNRIVHPPSTSVFNTKPNMSISKHGDSSSDESDDEGDIETARELFASNKSKKQIETLDINGKVMKRDTAAERKKMEEENMRKRLNVDLNPLYETILQWDYNRRAEYPNDDNIDKYSDVSDQFRSAEEYQRVMKPLLLLECWQGLCAARDRIENKPFSIVIGNRTAVSDFYEVYTSVPKQMLQDCSVSESDLIVLAYLPNNVPGDRLTSNNFKSAENTCLAKVRSLKYSKNNTVDVTLRIHRNHRFSKFLTLRAEIFALKVMQMTTVEREFQTLESLGYYDLVDQILQAKPSPSFSIPNEEIELVKKNYKLNTSQAEAIINTVLKDGFSLIQGPPGTGKTKTILGIVGYFLSLAKELPSNVIKTPVDHSTLTLEQMLKKQKILICAPSNAAVDEICLRLKDGVFNKNGVLFRPNLVRVGRSDVVNVAIKDLTLEELVERKVGEKKFEFTQDPDLDRKFGAAVAKRRTLRSQLDAENGSPTSNLSSDDIAKLQLEIRQLSKQINDLGKQKDEIREKNSVNYRSRDLQRRNAQLQILAGSDIICSTLSGSAHDVLASLGIKFDTVIIDEACQCTELSSIIPLRYGGVRCIMVGDPNQLPPTVLSGAASNFKYNQSLFVRMAKNATPYLLNVQYRMHPAISKFPSAEFYKGKLKDGPDMEIINKRPWHDNSHLSPYKFFDISSGQQEQNIKTMSLTNSEEVKVAIDLVDFLFKKYEDRVDFRGKIGVISPYREQMQKMRRDFTRYFGASINTFVDFNTIDGFQGQEKEIIIISCVRADDTSSSVGFLKDFRRMNVAFTRAKASLWILGHQRSLVKNKLWYNLIDDAKQRGCIEEVVPGFLSGKNRTIYNKEVTPDEADHYDPLQQYREIKKRRSVGDNNKPSNKKVRIDYGEDHNQRENKEKKKDKKDKDSKKEKKDKKEKKHKKDRNELSKSNGDKTKTSSAGTKKKSSIFGNPLPPVEVKKQKVFINDEKTKSKEKKKLMKTKGIKFSDNISTIPEDSELRSLPMSKNMPKPLKKIINSSEVSHDGEKEKVEKKIENKVENKLENKVENKLENKDDKNLEFSVGEKSKSIIQSKPDIVIDKSQISVENKKTSEDVNKEGSGYVSDRRMSDDYIPTFDDAALVSDNYSMGITAVVNHDSASAVHVPEEPDVEVEDSYDPTALVGNSAYSNKSVPSRYNNSRLAYPSNSRPPPQPYNMQYNAGDRYQGHHMQGGQTRYNPNGIQGHANVDNPSRPPPRPTGRRTAGSSSSSSLFIPKRKPPFRR